MHHQVLKVLWQFVTQYIYFRYMHQLREVFVWCRNYFILKAYSMVTVVNKKDTNEYAHYAISIKR